MSLCVLAWRTWLHAIDIKSKLRMCLHDIPIASKELCVCISKSDKHIADWLQPCMAFKHVFMIHMYARQDWWLSMCHWHILLTFAVCGTPVPGMHWTTLCRQGSRTPPKQSAQFQHDLVHRWIWRSGTDRQWVFCLQESLHSRSMIKNQWSTISHQSLVNTDQSSVVMHQLSVVSSQ